MRFRFFDQLTFHGMFAISRLEPDHSNFWRRLVSHSMTFGFIDMVLFPKRHGLAKWEVVYYFFFGVLFTGPGMDILFRIVGPYFKVFSGVGKAHLPDLRQFQQPTPDDAFKPNRLDGKWSYIEPGSVNAEDNFNGECDGRYLWVSGSSYRPFLLGIVLGIFALFLLIGGWMEWPFRDYLPWVLLALLLLTISNWFPHRKGALFDRDLQLVTIFRGWRKAPITLPLDDVGFASHFIGTGNFTRGLTIVSKRTPKGKWLPLTLELEAASGYGSAIQAAVSSIYDFMNKENIGGFNREIIKSIKLHQKHQLTLWRLHWHTPPAEEWAKYQAKDCIYQMDLPEAGTNHWNYCRYKSWRDDNDESYYVERYAELVLLGQEKEELDVVAKAKEHWPREAEERARYYLSLHFYAVLDLMSSYEKEQGKYPPILDELYADYGSSQEKDKLSIEELRNYIARYCAKKEHFYEKGSLSQEDYDALDVLKTLTQERIKLRNEEWDFNEHGAKIYYTNDGPKTLAF